MILYPLTSINVFLNTPNRLVPIEQASSGTMDQVYLALRIAAGRLMQGRAKELPFIFDDSFVNYDNKRLKTVLDYLVLEPLYFGLPIM